MAAKLSSCFLSNQWMQSNSSGQSNLRFAFPSRSLLPASCKMRQRNFSSPHKRQNWKKVSSQDYQLDANLQQTGNDKVDKVESENNSGDEISSLKEVPGTDDATATATATFMQSVNVVGGEKLSTIPLEDLISMIRNAETNILLLDQARIRALEDLKRILSEKEALQGEINILEMRLVQTDAKIKVAKQEKIHAQILEKQLERMRMELSGRGGSMESMKDFNGTDSRTSAAETLELNRSIFEELNSLRTENKSLKGDIEALRAEIGNVKTTDERVALLEKERSRLNSAVRDLELKLAASTEDAAKLSPLKIECQNLLERVEDLQALLDKAAEGADQAVLILQQNQELQKKVDILEESLQESRIFKLSSENMQKENEIMQQKIKALEEHLQKSDEEIHKYVQLYQESNQEFLETIHSLRQEGKKRALDEPVDDMPRGFWSHLLLMIDGWSLEQKLSSNDAIVLREMVWKKDKRIRDAYLACKEDDELSLAAFMQLASNDSTSSSLYVVHIAAEMAPVAKVGGLGDVVTGLSKALQKKGHLVEIILPKYDCMQYDLVHGLKALDVEVESYFDKQLYKNKIWIGTIEGLPVYFIEPHHPSKLFWRGQYYGEHDDFKRFSFFSRAALELLVKAGKKPDMIHCHDWQTAFVAPLYWEIYTHKGLKPARICFTCHNFEYQGKARASELRSCGLDPDDLNKPDKMQDNSAHDVINPVKGAIVFSNIVTTVSPTYAQEVLTPEGGRGLHTTLNSYSRKFVGILNGIDTDFWDPVTDSFLEAHYSSSNLRGKLENKEALRRHLQLSSVDVARPLVGCITRLVPQKGVHLIRHAIYRTIELGGQFVLLGSSPVDHIQREFEGIASHFESHEHARLILKYDESLSHLIYAASDMLIVPSIFEPCGLTQMIAMRYGSIPIARKTGGLNDSVFDVDDEAIPAQFQNGFMFFTPDEQGVNSALDRAFHRYKNDRESWQQLVRKVMSMDFSWDSSASQYEELYQRSVARARGPPNCS